MSKLHINIFTDPTCPFAYSLEPTRWRLKWLYRDRISWQDTMITLSGYDSETSPMTPQRISKSRDNLQKQHGMPMNINPLPRVPQTLLASKNYIAIRLNNPKAADAFLRQLRIASMDNELIDEQEVLNKTISSVGLNPIEVTKWLDSPETDKTLKSEAEMARNPSPKAKHFSHKLSTTSTGRTRYPASSFVFTVNDTTFELPGFWPLAAYEAIIGNLVPDAVRSQDSESTEEVLTWANTPLATIEVAKVMNCDVEKARKNLKEIAKFTAVGQDGFWYLG